MGPEDTILIIAKNHAGLNAQREIKNIREALEPIAHHVEIHAPDDPEPHELVTQLRVHNPSVLHLASHGSIDDDGSAHLEVADADGFVKSINLKLLRDYLRQRAEEEGTRRIKCIFLNACYLGDWASNLLDVADVVIGTTARLPEPTAQLFAQKFYEHIARQCSVQAAYCDAKVALEFEEEPGVDCILIACKPADLASRTYIGRTPDQTLEPAWHASADEGEEIPFDGVDTLAELKGNVERRVKLLHRRVEAGLVDEPALTRLSLLYGDAQDRVNSGLARLILEIETRGEPDSAQAYLALAQAVQDKAVAFIAAADFAILGEDRGSWADRRELIAGAIGRLASLIHDRGPNKRLVKVLRSLEWESFDKLRG